MEFSEFSDCCWTFCLLQTMTASMIAQDREHVDFGKLISETLYTTNPNNFENRFLFAN